MKDIYLYDGIDVLRNKLNIKNSEELECAEADITYIKLLDVDRVTINGNFDIWHLKSIHKYIFEDIYDWAGEIRGLNIEKSEDVLYNLSVQYCDYSLIEKETKRLLKHIKNIDWQRLSRDELVECFSKSTAELWRIHPFREGNTRTVITFMTQFAELNGFNINRELLRKYSSFVRKSLVLASIDEYSQYEHLIKIMNDAMDNNK